MRKSTTMGQMSDEVKYSDSSVLNSLFNSQLKKLFKEFDPNTKKKKRPIIDPDTGMIEENSRLFNFWTPILCATYFFNCMYVPYSLAFSS